MRILISSLAALSLASLTACGSADPANPAASEAADTAEGSLGGAIAAVPGMATLSGLLTSTGLNGVFDGQGGYTVLAPNDAAFQALGEKAALLGQPDQKAAAAAVIRGHMLPGALSVEDIAKAVDAAGGKPVSMKTLAGGTVNFTKDGSDIVVSAEGGGKAKLSGTTVKAGNNAALPIDAVLLTQ